MTRGIRLIGFEDYDHLLRQNTLATPIFLTECSMEIDITHTFADIKIQHRYENNTNKMLKPYFVISKDLEGFRLTGFEIKTSGMENKIIQSEIIPMNAALQYYSRFIESHGVIEKRLPADTSVHQIEIAAPMMPKDQIDIQCNFTAQIKLVKPDEFNEFMLTIPSSLYLADSCVDERLTPLTVEVTVRTDEGTRIFSLSHGSGDGYIKTESKKTLPSLTSSIMFYKEETQNIDFVLLMSKKSSLQPTLICEKEKPKSSKSKRPGSIMMQMMPQYQPILSSRQTEILVVVCYSGRYDVILDNMLPVLLHSIPDCCIFDVMVVPCKRRVFSCSQSVTDTKRNMALKAVSECNNKNSGDDEFLAEVTLEALEECIKSKEVDGVPRRVMLITDGDMEGLSIQKFLAVWQFRPEYCSLFTISIGKRSPILEDIALLGFGDSAWIQECSNASRNIIKCFTRKAVQYDIREISIVWKNFQGDKMDVKPNGEGEGFVQIPAVIKTWKEGKVFRVFVFSENSIVLPTSAEISVKSPGEKSRRFELKLKDAVVVPHRQIQTIAVSKMLKEKCPKRHEVAIAFATKTKILFEGSTIVPVQFGQNKRKSMCENWILPINPDRNLYDIPAMSFLSSTICSEPDVKKNKFKYDTYESRGIGYEPLTPD